ncbi:THUMP domain-containing protein 2 [Spea bombifrons]|uniref:THUMP domain-containing protein 2 n=1 Tax=Spea bombifrons TaxID=233779 RepID=UPI00234B6351|nr:THUMP domain-containing protein 2 [Spea bombifrons]
MEPDCSIKRVRFFFTAGRGMDRFLIPELTHKAAAVDIEATPGKVFFSAEPDMCRLTQIKSGERLFLLLHKGPSLSLPKHKGNALSVLRQVVIGENRIWKDSLGIWQNLQEPLQQEERMHGDHFKVARRKLEKEPTLHGSELCKEEHDAVDETSMFHLKTLNSSIPQPEGQAHSNAGERNKAQPLPAKAWRAITFRVSCRCSGANAKLFSSEEVGRAIGISLVKLLGWKPDLRRPDLEVFVHLNDLYSVVGFPVVRQPLASRGYIRNTGLRSTTAWAMASLAEINAGAVVLDPMCGVGTILLEGAKEWPHVQFIGIDISDSQIKSATGNVKAAGVAGSIELVKGSVLDLPVLSESIDVVISDIPFGKKFTSSKNMKDLLPEILQEMERVLRVGGSIVLLLSQSLHRHLKALFQFEATRPENVLPPKNETGIAASTVNRTNWSESLIPIESHSVSLGVTEAVIFKCRKSSKSTAC